MTTTALILVVVLGAYSLVGGVAGYVKQKSTASLIAGGASGLALLGCAFLMNGGNTMAGWVALVVTFALLGRFLPAFLKKKKWWPAGYMVALAVPTLLALLASLI